MVKDKTEYVLHTIHLYKYQVDQKKHIHMKKKHGWIPLQTKEDKIFPLVQNIKSMQEQYDKFDHIKLT